MQFSEHELGLKATDMACYEVRLWFRVLGFRLNSEPKIYPEALVPSNAPT